MLVGLIKDESGRYDGYNWHDAYAQHFNDLGDQVEFLDFKRANWQQQVDASKADFFMWRAWHVPDDRDDAKAKIYHIEKNMKRPIFPNWDMYQPYDNKVAQLFMLRSLGLRHPTTFHSRDIEEIMGFAESAKLPLVSKCSEGACGDNVRLIEDQVELKQHIGQLFSQEGVKTSFPWVYQRGYVYFQEYLPAERDIRTITIGDKVELAFCRENSHSWKKNIAGGGRISAGNIPDSAIDMVVELARKTGFHWCAADIIIHNDMPYLLEFSSIFGFSKSGFYEKHFGSPNAFILKKQAQYLHNLFSNGSKK
jgi:glutathione synthase/RimK-type ligase-like ATP-grasp enzyme